MFLTSKLLFSGSPPVFQHSTAAAPQGQGSALVWDVLSSPWPLLFLASHGLTAVAFAVL